MAPADYFFSPFNPDIQQESTLLFASYQFNNNKCKNDNRLSLFTSELDFK